MEGKEKEGEQQEVFPVSMYVRRGQVVISQYPPYVSAITEIHIQKKKKN